MQDRAAFEHHVRLPKWNGDEKYTAPITQKITIEKRSERPSRGSFARIEGNVLNSGSACQIKVIVPAAVLLDMEARRGLPS